MTSERASNAQTKARYWAEITLVFVFSCCPGVSIEVDSVDHGRIFGTNMSDIGTIVGHRDSHCIVGVLVRR